MSKVVYKLTTKDASEVIKNEDGSYTIVFEAPLDEPMTDPDECGDFQSDMLWECFNHNFSSYDDDGNEVGSL